MAINIKKSHRGRFTAYKKRTGKTTAEALHSSDPHVRSMANFARMAKRGFKKLQYGGYNPEDVEYLGADNRMGSNNRLYGNYDQNTNPSSVTPEFNPRYQSEYEATLAEEERKRSGFEKVSGSAAPVIGGLAGSLIGAGGGALAGTAAATGTAALASGIGAGAATGAAAGSFAPVIGTAIGAAVGVGSVLIRNAIAKKRAERARGSFENALNKFKSDTTLTNYNASLGTGRSLYRRGGRMKYQIGGLDKYPENAKYSLLSTPPEGNDDLAMRMKRNVRIRLKALENTGKLPVIKPKPTIELSDSWNTSANYSRSLGKDPSTNVNEVLSFNKDLFNFNVGKGKNPYPVSVGSSLGFRDIEEDKDFTYDLRPYVGLDTFKYNNLKRNLRAGVEGKAGVSILSDDLGNGTIEPNFNVTPGIRYNFNDRENRVSPWYIQAGLNLKGASPVTKNLQGQDKYINASPSVKFGFGENDRRKERIGVNVGYERDLLNKKNRVSAGLNIYDIFNEGGLMDDNVNSDNGRNLYKRNNKYRGLAKGGFEPLSSDESQVNSGSSGTDNVPLGNAMVDDNEVLRKTPQGTEVFSDDLGFAKYAKYLGQQKGVLEQSLNTVKFEATNTLRDMDGTYDNHKKGSLKRTLDSLNSDKTKIESQIANIDQALEQLFAQQQEVNGNNGEDSQEQVEGQPGFQVGGLYDTNKVGYVDSVLTANKNLDWVQRLYKPTTKSDIIPTPKDIPGYRSGITSTHLMSDNNEGYVFPSVVNIDGKLEYLGNKAEDYARETGTGIQLPKEQGTWFARDGYKKGTNVLKYQIGGKYKYPYNSPYYNDIPEEYLGSPIIEPVDYSSTLRNTQPPLGVYGIDQVDPRTVTPAKLKKAVAVTNPTPSGSGSPSFNPDWIEPIVNLGIASAQRFTKIPEPTYLPYNPIDTKYDISAPLGDIATRRRGYENYIKSNLSNANVAASMMAGAGAGDISARNKLYDVKNKTEKALENRNVELLTINQAQNAAIKDKYNMSKYANKIDYLSKLSQINANVADTTKWREEQKALARRDVVSLALYKSLDANRGVWDRNLLNSVMANYKTEGELRSALITLEYDSTIIEERIKQYKEAKKTK